MPIGPNGEFVGPRTFTDAISICLTGYARFAGRAPRSEYWYFSLFSFLMEAVGAIIDSRLFGMTSGIFGFLIGIGLLIPGLAVLIRRLHDIDRSGWWWLIVLIPIVGAIILLVWMCTRGTAAPNRFGPDPLGAAHGPNAQWRAAG